jgi:hypothetical protein
VDPFWDKDYRGNLSGLAASQSFRKIGGVVLLLELDELDELLELEPLEEDELLLLAACDCAMIVDNDTDRGLNCMAEA